MVRETLSETPVVDFHTHLFAPEFGRLNLWGVDELLTYHYLVAEALRAMPEVPAARFLAAGKPEQADLIWKALFLDRTPLSEATIGVLTVLKALGVDPGDPLEGIRSWFAEQDPAAHLDRVMGLAGVESITMTNDPFDPEEAPLWQSVENRDPRFAAALRIDRLVHSFEAVCPQFEGDGDAECRANRYLDRWIERMRPKYVAASFPPDFEPSAVIGKVVLPTCRRNGLPFALMIGVRRAVNPALGPAGDGMGLADLSWLERLCLENPDQRFVVTVLAKENQQGLCVLARKFSNLGVFGCWWFSNNPSIVEEITDMRFEMLGDTFIPQHSDARVVEQLIYKWRNARHSVANSLARRLAVLEEAGQPVTKARVESVAKRLLQDNPRSWMGGS